MDFDWSVNVANIMYIFLIALSVLSGCLLVSRYGLKTFHGKAFLGLTIGILLFLFGELLWIFYSLKGTDPFPSVADIFYLLAYPFLFFAFFIEIKLAEITLGLKKFLWLTFGFLALSAIFFYFAFGSLAEFTGMADFISFLYVIGDIVLILCLVLLSLIIIEYKKGRIAEAWLWFLSGFLFILIADFIFSIFQSGYEENVYVYAITDSAWLLGYGLIAIGMMRFNTMIKNEENKIKQKIKNLIK